MKEGYERDFLRYLQSLLAEVERRIRRGHARLALSQAQQNAGVCAFGLGNFIITFTNLHALSVLPEQHYIYLFLQGPGPAGKNEEKVQVLTEKIEDLVLQVCKEYIKISNLFLIDY